MRIAIYLYDGMTALDAVGPFDLLNRLPDTMVVMVGDGAGGKLAQGGLSLVARHDLTDVTEPDVILLPGGGPRIREEMGNHRLLDWIRSCDRSTAWTASVCTGSLILGAAGLLEGRRATTHWRAREHLARFGATYVDERVVQDGKLVTGAGVTAGLDLALQLAEQLAGRHIAQAVQLSAQYEPVPPFPPLHFTDASERLLATVTDELGP